MRKARRDIPNHKATRRHLSYITTKVVVTASRRAMRIASTRAMQIAGYVIEAKNGWIIRRNEDGTTERLNKIANYKKHTKVALD